MHCEYRKIFKVWHRKTFKVCWAIFQHYAWKGLNTILMFQVKISFDRSSLKSDFPEMNFSIIESLLTHLFPMRVFWG